MNTRRIRGEDGFILAVAVLAMVVVGAAVAAGYFIGNQEYHVGKSVRESTGAFYAAQAGMEREYATWSIPNRFTMSGGDSIPIGPVSLANGSSYRGMVTRIDNTPRSDQNAERYYMIRVTGAAPAPVVGEEVRNLQAMLLRVRYYDFGQTAALTAKDTVTQSGNSIIDGNNNNPLAWGSQCDSASTTSMPGAQVECATCMEVSGGSNQRLGSPPVAVDTTLQSKNLIDWDEVTWELLKSKAQKIYPPDASVGPIAPVVGVDPSTGLPVCNKSVLSNWGEPNNALHPCFEYFPIIYAQGNLRMNDPGNGQGILLVEGDLKINSGAGFYGIVIIRGHLDTQGQAGKFWGSVIVGGQNTGSITNTKLSGSATIRWSSCAVMRAKRFAELAKKEPLPLRAWTEALN